MTLNAAERSIKDPLRFTTLSTAGNIGLERAQVAPDRLGWGICVNPDPELTSCEHLRATRQEVPGRITRHSEKGQRPKCPIGGSHTRTARQCDLRNRRFGARATNNWTLCR